MSTERASARARASTGSNFVVGERVARSPLRPGSIANAMPITVAARVRRARRRSRRARASPRARTRAGGSIRCGRCRCRPRRSRRRSRAGDALQRAAAGMAVDRADVADRARRRAASGGAVQRGHREHRDVAHRVERDDASRATRCRLVSTTVVDRSPATTCALVTTSPGAATQPLPSWIWSHACPVDLHRSTRAPCASTAGVSDVLGGGARVRAATASVPSADGIRRVGDRAAPRREPRRLRRRPALDRGDDRRARAPCARASPARSRATG